MENLGPIVPVLRGADFWHTTSRRRAIPERTQLVLSLRQLPRFEGQLVEATGFVVLDREAR